MRRRVFACTIELLRDRLEYGVIDQCGLAGAGNAGDTGHQPERDRHVDRLEVVARRAFDDELPLLVSVDAFLGDFNPAPARQVLAS